MSDKLSESEEMYLASIASLLEMNPEGPVPLTRLAEALAIQPVSANQMVRKLAEAGLVSYTPYHGVVLTELGLAEALNILRHRRLWEVFLVERLQFSLAEASLLACRLEHTLPPEAAEQLAAYLDQPSVSPGGLPVPAPNAAVLHTAARPLSQLQPGQTGLVVEIHSGPTERGFFEQQGIRPGQRLLVLAEGSKNLLVRGEGGSVTTLSGALAEAVLIILSADLQV